MGGGGQGPSPREDESGMGEDEKEDEEEDDEDEGEENEDEEEEEADEEDFQEYVRQEKEQKKLRALWAKEGRPVPPALDYLLADWGELSYGEGWRELADTVRWFIAVLLATKEDGTMFTRDWDSLDFAAELPVPAPAWLLKKAMLEEEEEEEDKVKEDADKEENVKKDNEEENFKKDSKEENIKKDSEAKEIKLEDDEKDVDKEDLKEEGSEVKEEEVKDELKLIQDTNEATPRSERVLRKEGGWSASQGGKRSLGAQARSARRLLEHQAGLEATRGPSRLQLQQRHLQPTNLLEELDRCGEEEDRWEEVEEEEAKEEDMWWEEVEDDDDDDEEPAGADSGREDHGDEVGGGEVHESAGADSGLDQGEESRGGARSPWRPLEVSKDRIERGKVEVGRCGWEEGGTRLEGEGGMQGPMVSGGIAGSTYYYMPSSTPTSATTPPAAPQTLGRPPFPTPPQSPVTRLPRPFIQTFTPPHSTLNTPLHSPHPNPSCSPLPTPYPLPHSLLHIPFLYTLYTPTPSLHSFYQCLGVYALST